jgi:predicted dehydrogenase
MLADPAIDAVVIVTPARTHTGLIEAAARGQGGLLRKAHGPHPRRRRPRHRRRPPGRRPAPDRPAVTGQDARAALSIARAAIQSVITGIPVRIDELKAE